MVFIISSTPITRRARGKNMEKKEQNPVKKEIIANDVSDNDEVNDDNKNETIDHSDERISHEHGESVLTKLNIHIMMNYDKPLSYYVHMISQEMLKHQDLEVQKQLVKLQLMFISLNNLIMSSSTTITHDRIKMFIKETDFIYKTKEAAKDKNWDLLKYYIWLRQYLERYCFQILLEETLEVPPKEWEGTVEDIVEDAVKYIVEDDNIDT